jgi:hypothetical protein
MLKQGKKVLLGAGVVAALGIGGSALGAAGAAPAPPAAHHSSVADHDQIESGDQSTPDVGAEAPGTETADGPQATKDNETQDGTSESGSEVPNNDGPGGHADEPGNPNADHQAGGQTEE